MRKLKIPSIPCTVKDIYFICANDFTRKEQYKEIALSYADRVEECSDKYEGYVPRNIAEFPHGEVNEFDKKIIIKLYEQKFAEDGSIGRKYYDLIKGNAKRCPICGGGRISNLDHFLPKSKYPLLCVTIANLIPVCRDCNIDKGKTTSEDYFELPFHPYLEEMKDIWLECKLFFISDTVRAEYLNGYPESKDPDMWRKYNAHMRITGIAGTFTCKAEEELENVKCMYADLLDKGGKYELTQALISEKSSAESIDMNSWKSALYRALVNQMDDFSTWLICEMV